MSFDLVIAARRDPIDMLAEGNAPAASSSATLVLSGQLDVAGIEAVISAVGELGTRDVRSIVLKLQDVTPAAGSCELLGRAMMALRSTGVHIQVLTECEELHGRMAAAEDARDWLLDHRRTDGDMPRQALHLDGPPRPRRREPATDS